MKKRLVKALKITIEGEMHEISPKNGKTFELKEVQDYVEGYIEIVHLNKDLIMIINEEGKFNKGFNVTATQIAYQYNAIRDGDYICGDVVVCPSRRLP